MAQTALVVTVLKQNNVVINAGDLVVTMTASDTVNGNSFPATGNEVLLVQNTDVSAHTFTITSTPDVMGRTSDLAAYSLAASAIVAIQEANLGGWRQVDGNIYLVSTSALLKYGVLFVK
jgi:hypothetical protein